MSSTVVFRCIRVWVVHFRGGFTEVFGRPPPEVGPAGPVSKIRSEFPGRVLSYVVPRPSRHERPLILYTIRNDIEK